MIFQQKLTSQASCKISFWYTKYYQYYDTNVPFFELLLEHLIEFLLICLVVDF